MRPYPYERWPRVSRAEVSSLRAQARGGPLAALVSGAPGASEWLGARVAVELAGPPRPQVGELGDPITAVLFEDPSGRRAALVMDAAIASAIVDRAVGGDGDALEGASGALRDVERGVLAYAMARWIAGRSPFAIAAVLSSAPAVAAALGDLEHARWPLAIGVGATHGGGALIGSRALEPSPARARRLAEWARALPIEHAIEAGVATLAASEIAALARGDVVVPDRCGLAVASGALTGSVVIIRRHAQRALQAELDRGQLRVVGAELRARPVPGTKEGAMKDPEGLLDTMGDTPVTLSLELARFTLPLEEAAALCPGEIVRAGAPIGASVTLRAGDRVIASGELVDVDGEIGVRILQLGA